jgi:hypothetical protein
MRCLQKERKLDGFNCVSFLEVSSILRVCRLRFQCCLEQLAVSRLSLRLRKSVSCLEKRSYQYSHRWHIGRAAPAVHHLSHARSYPLRRMTATGRPTARHATARRSQAEFLEWLGFWAILDYGATVWRHTCHAPFVFLDS